MQKHLITVLIILCVLLLVAEAFVHKHGHFGFENIFGFHALFGFLAFAIAVFAGRIVRFFLGRREDYYDQ